MLKNFIILILLLSNVLTFTMFSITHEPVQDKKECPENKNITLKTFDGGLNVKQLYRIGENDYVLSNLKRSYDNSYDIERDVISVEFKKVK